MLNKSKGATDKNFILAYIIDGDFPKVDGILSELTKIPEDADGNAWLAAAIRFGGANMVKLLIGKGITLDTPPTVVNATIAVQEWAQSYRKTPFII